MIHRTDEDKRNAQQRAGRHMYDLRVALLMMFDNDITEELDAHLQALDEAIDQALMPTVILFAKVGVTVHVDPLLRQVTEVHVDDENLGAFASAEDDFNLTWKLKKDEEKADVPTYVHDAITVATDDEVEWPAWQFGY